MVDLYLPAVLVAFVITVVEMTEVVALVFALAADHHTVAHGALGAVSGTAVVALAALGFGAFIVAFPRSDLLWGSALVLFAFGVFIFRSTLRSYQRARAATSAAPTGAPQGARSTVQFAGGFSVGAVEAIEAVIVLIALAAAGYGVSAIVGAVAGGVALVGSAAAVHDRIRRIKVPTLKLGATSMLFAFGVFWAGEAGGVAWPGSDLVLIPLFLASLLVVRGALWLMLPAAVPVKPNR